MMAERLSGLPPAGRGMGDWYETRRPISNGCPECGREYQQAPSVCEYLPALDEGGEQARKHPGWQRLGWLVWWQCSHCDADVLTPVTAEQVAQWGRELGGWRPGA